VLETANGDATRLPFADGAFDRVIASEVMEHINDDAAAVTELARVLRPGGTIAVTVPSQFPEKVCWSLSEDYYAPKAAGGHVRIYRRQQLVNMLQTAGMEPAGHHRVHALHSPYWWLRCLVGPNRPIADSRLVALYHRLLAWDIEKAPRLTRWAERALNPLLGKSLVVYAIKPSEESSRAAA
jgi:SAM-dependent methyltransferase